MENFDSNLSSKGSREAVLKTLLLKDGQEQEDPKQMLKKQYDELSYLCINYDPYTPEKSTEIIQLLEKYKLSHIEDPFTITNYLLKMLDECEAQIKDDSPEIH